MTQLLAAQVRALITERDRLSGRIALLESSIDDMSGTIKKQAAATAAVLVAKENPPAPSTKTQAASPPAANADKDTTASIPPNPLPKADPTPSAVPMPPARIANASAVENDQPAPKQAEFGLDLGGGATGYRLTVGPLPNSAAATGLCAFCCSTHRVPRGQIRGRADCTAMIVDAAARRHTD
jgi:uncharacterized membrane protein